MAAVFRIEHPSTPESIRELIGLLEIWLIDRPELKRMFAVWIRATLMRGLTRPSTLANWATSLVAQPKTVVKMMLKNQTLVTTQA